MIIKHSDGTIHNVELDMNSDDSLAHYGVKGMHWGVRKEDKAIRAENREAFRRGASATLTRMAYERSVKRQERARQRYTQDPYSKRNRRNYEVQQSTTKELKRLKEASENSAKSHENDLKKKYGSENVKSIKRDKNGRIKERTVSTAAIATSLGISAGSALALALGAPIGVFMAPRTTGSKSRTLEKNVRKRYKNAWNNEYRHGTNWNRNNQF